MAMQLSARLQAERDVVERLEGQASEYQRQLDLGLSRARHGKVSFFLERVLVNLELHRAMVAGLEERLEETAWMEAEAQAGRLAGVRIA